MNEFGVIGLGRIGSGLAHLDALRMEVPVPVIAQSVIQLFASRDKRKDWARAIVAMRHSFGGHPYGKDDEVAQERREGRVGEILGSEKL